VDCETLLVADEGQALILLTARPGTPAQERLQLLRVIGEQDLAPVAPESLRPAQQRPRSARP
jgi:hypothetical protein